MKTVEVKVYEFKELSEKAKEKAKMKATTQAERDYARNLVDVCENCGTAYRHDDPDTWQCKVC